MNSQDLLSQLPGLVSSILSWVVSVDWLSVAYEIFVVFLICSVFWLFVIGYLLYRYRKSTCVKDI